VRKRVGVFLLGLFYFLLDIIFYCFIPDILNFSLLCQNSLPFVPHHRPGVLPGQRVEEPWSFDVWPHASGNNARESDPRPILDMAISQWGPALWSDWDNYDPR
jgi:hypothetical protein